MKHTKRLLALLLAFALTLGLAMPALAIINLDGTEPEWDGDPLIRPLSDTITTNPAMPVIAVQPQDASASSCTGFTLSIEAEAPNGDPLRYEWYEVRTGADVLISTDASFSARICITSPDAGTEQFLLYCIVYNANDDSLFVQSETATVTISFGAMPGHPQQPRTFRTILRDVLYFITWPFQKLYQLLFG